MIVSRNWLEEYVTLDMSDQVLTDRLTMSGLNLEGLDQVDGDLGIDLEVTSNRPDCLGHIGVAREISVLFDTKLTVPNPQPSAIAESTAKATSVDIESEDLCPQYVARVIRGVKIGPSPDWLTQRLSTLGIASINNVVDITNYVLMETGQPLHAFDFDKLHGGKIVVRRARDGEKIVAIDQREYPLDTDMCVIADADHAVAIAGVMGGLETEIGEQTVNVLIETADFAPISIRSTARKLSLHSDSSFRFERGVDPLGIDWASRRCCQLILELAGGELLAEPIVAGRQSAPSSPPIPLRFAQIPRILGVDIPKPEAISILNSLGIESHGKASGESGEFVAPSWRADLTREVDLIEEVARIHGYDNIPSDVDVPLEVSSKSRHDRVTARMRELLCAAGLFEAVTLSFTSEDSTKLFSPRGDLPLLRVEHSSRKHENILRQSLIPSLLVSRRENERQGTFNAQLFEIAKVYLKAAPGNPEQEVEPMLLSMVSGRSFGELKGLVETLARSLNAENRVTVKPSDVPQFAEGRGAQVFLNDQPWGWLGELDRSVTDRLDLRDAVSVAELDIVTLENEAELTPTYSLLPQFPAIERDLNFVLDDPVSWQDVEAVVRESAGPLLESVSFGGQYRGKQIDADKKSYVVTLGYRSPERTLTGDEVQTAADAVVAACREKLGAELRSS